MEPPEFAGDGDGFVPMYLPPGPCFFRFCVLGNTTCADTPAHRSTDRLHLDLRPSDEAGGGAPFAFRFPRRDPSPVKSGSERIRGAGRDAILWPGRHGPQTSSVTTTGFSPGRRNVLGSMTLPRAFSTASISGMPMRRYRGRVELGKQGVGLPDPPCPCRALARPAHAVTGGFRSDQALASALVPARSPPTWLLFAPATSP